jgi:hypothetical protein
MPKKKKATKAKKPASKKIKASPAKTAKNFSLASKINKPSAKSGVPKKVIVASVVIFILACLAAWWQFIFADPNRVLSDMLAGNLRTTGVIKEVRQSGGQSDITQNTYLSFIDGPKSQTVTTLKQASPAGTTNEVTTENIGTPSEDYIRYRTIDVSSGGQTDVSTAENIWASKSSQEKGADQQVNFLTEGLFGIVAFGNFDKNQAGTLRNSIDESGLYQYSSVDKKFESGRLVYTYQIEMTPANLINYLAGYSLLLGVDHKGQLDPKNYAGAQPVKVAVSVDVLSRQLRSIEYTDSGRVERYSGFGLKRAIEIPSETISITELQRRLQPAQ